MQHDPARISRVTTCRDANWAKESSENSGDMAAFFKRVHRAHFDINMCAKYIVADAEGIGGPCSAPLSAVCGEFCALPIAATRPGLP